MSSNRNTKKTFALLTVPRNEKLLEILTFNDAVIISDNKYSGNNFMENASTYLLDLKNGKNLEGVILDFYCHEDTEFLNKVRKYFSEFCENKVILFRLVYQNVIFTSMLLYHSDLDFTPDDTVYAIWIKNDSFVSYKVENSTLYFINEMEIEDDFVVNKDYDELLDCENPKFLVLGSRSSDARLKKLKNRFKASKTKVMHCTYEDCLKKSASHYMSRFIRAKDWRWNFKLSDSTNPETQKYYGLPRRRKSRKALILKSLIACVLLAIVVALFSSNSPKQLTGNNYYSDITKVSKNDEEIYGFVYGEADEIRLTIYGAQTKRGIGVISKRKEIFNADFPTIFEHPKFKAIIIQIDSLSDHVLFYKTMKYHLHSSLTDIPYSFVNDHTFMYTSILMASNINVNIGEYVRMVLVNDDTYEMAELQYTEHGFIEVGKLDVPGSLDLEQTTPELIRHKIFGSNNPARIILHANYLGLASMKLLREVVLKDDSEMVIALEEDFKKYEAIFVYEKVKYMLDNSYTRFHIPPKSHRRYMIGFKCGEKEYPLIVCEKNEILPFQKMLTIPKLPLQYFFGSTNLYNYGLFIHSNITFDKKAHVYQFSLEVDVDNFLNTSVTTGAFLALSHFGGYLDEMLPSNDEKLIPKTPVIAFYGDLSFIYLHDYVYDGYKVVDSWNGEYGRELFISFDEKRIKLFKKATKVFQSTCASTVHDLIKVLSYSPEDIPLSNPTFGYNITKDCKNKIWYRFNAFNGTTKKASPTFLMSILLKEHIKAIERELLIKPDEIAIYLFEEFDESAGIRIKNGLQESCNLAEIDCIFIDTLPIKILNI